MIWVTATFKPLSAPPWTSRYLSGISALALNIRSTSLPRFPWGFSNRDSIRPSSITVSQ